MLLRILSSGLLQGICVIAFSLLFNVALFGEYNEMITVGRDPDSAYMRVALPALTLLWGVALAFAFSIFHHALRGNRIQKGFKFGVLMWATQAVFLEVFNYVLYEFPFMAIFAGWLCYFFALTVGGMLMARVQLSDS